MYIHIYVCINVCIYIHIHIYVYVCMCIHIHTHTFMGFPGSSAGKESTCNAGDPGLIPGSGRSP